MSEEITHHVEISTTKGTNRINISDNEKEILLDEMSNDPTWIIIRNRYFSSVNVVSMSIYKGIWKKPELREQEKP